MISMSSSTALYLAQNIIIMSCVDTAIDILQDFCFQSDIMHAL